MRIKVTDIEWDQDDDDSIQLPTALFVLVDVDDYDTSDDLYDACVDEASDAIGYCILSCNVII